MKELNKKQAKLENVKDIEDGQKFIEKEFEEQKEKIKDLIKDNKKMFPDNQRLHNKTKALYQSKIRKKTK